MIALDSALKGACYVSTYSGQQLYPLAPDADQINIEDIVHGLANQACFHGQTSDFYSLAQHSLLVASLVPVQLKLAALLHDAAAAYFGEMAPSVRQLLPEFCIIEKRVMAAIGERFAVSDFAAPAIKRAHQIAQATEYRDVRPHSALGQVAQGRLAPIPRRIEFMSPDEAKDQFMELFGELTRQNNPWKPPPAVCREDGRSSLAALYGQARGSQLSSRRAGLGGGA